MFWLLGGSRGRGLGFWGVVGGGGRGGSSPLAVCSIYDMWDCLQKEVVESYVEIE